MWKFFKHLSDNDFKEWMAVYVITFTFIYFILITFIPLSETGQRFADIILGALISTCLMTVLNFFFKKGDKTTNSDETKTKPEP